MDAPKPENGEIKLTVPMSLIPYCPHCGKPMSMNLRSDQTFVEHAFYVCLNQGEAYVPDEIMRKSVCMNEDIGEVLKEL